MPGSTAPSSGACCTAVGSSLATGATGAAAGAAAPPGSVSARMIGAPTPPGTPSGTSSSVTTPANGDGSSTSDFAVSISTIVSLIRTLSPGRTRQVTISASVRPSPASGRRNRSILGTAASSVGQDAIDGVEHAVEAGQVLVLQPAGRVRDVESAHSQHRRLQRVEAALGDARRDLRAESEERRGLVHDDEPASALHRGDES